MFRFENTEYFVLLAIVPILIALFFLIIRRDKRISERFANRPAWAKLNPELALKREWLRMWIIIIVLVFTVLALANPQWGSKREKVISKSSDVFIALDISQSMLAEDISPNRLERAKRMALKLVDELRRERIGLILFAGNAYMQMPLTSDHAAAKIFLRGAHPGLAGTQGTAIVEAINLASRSFPEEDEKHKVLIVISDGENHDQEAIERASQAKEEGMLIFGVGVGTAEGGLIPLKYGGQSNFKRDKTGNPVKTRLNENMLKDLVNAGNGKYFHILEGNQIYSTLTETIEGLEKKEIELGGFREYNSYFQYFLFFGILFLITEFLITNRKLKWFKDKDLFDI